MIVAILILIVLILLFGAGVVKGWLANAFGIGLGLLAIFAVLIWIGSMFGIGFVDVFLIIGGLFVTVGVIFNAFFASDSGH